MTRRARRFCFGLITFAFSLALVVAAGIGLLFVRLSNGSMTVAALDAPVLSAFSAHMPPGFHVSLSDVEIDAVDGRPAVAVNQLLVRNEAGQTIFKAPRAVIALDPLRLIGGTIVPTRLDVPDLVLKISILPDGSAALAAGTDDAAPVRIGEAIAASASPAPGTGDGSADVLSPQPILGASTEPPVARFTTLMAKLIDGFTDVDHVMGGLDRFGVDRGTLILDDQSHGVTTSFRNLAIDFQKTDRSASKLAVSADGDAGRWSVSLWGARQAGSQRSFSIDAQNVTVADLGVIPALQDVGFDTDIPLSANVTVGLDTSGALAVARGRVTLGSGFFRLHDPDHEPYLLDAMNGSFHFDPETKRIVVDTSTWDAQDTHYEMAGEAVPPGTAAEPWAVSLAGKGDFGAERPGEKPLALDRITFAARLFPDQNKLAIEQFDLAGPQVAVGVKADIQSGDKGLLIKGDAATTGRMPAQALLRLWPTPLAAQVRAWLLVNLQSGMLDRGNAAFSLDDADLARMKIERSVADDHLRVDYAISDATLAFMPAVPPLRRVAGSGVVTGDTSKFVVKQGAIEVSQGHQLNVLDGSLTVPSTDPKPTPATIVAHIAGGVDALTDLLSRDALKSYANLPPDMANAKGQIDGTLTVGLKIGRGASPNDVSVGATAQVSKLAIEKLVGKQDLTDGAIDLVLDKTGLRIKGDARLFDAPTSIDVKKPAGTAPGEANATLTLDEAARVKAGLNLGRALTGPVTAKVSTVIGGSADQRAAINVDLSKATINNLLPGFAKSSGKPGRLTLVAVPGSNGVALDNINCDIGSLSLRGNASLDANGGFQAAHLSQFRVSPGDDMKVDITQGPDGLKLSVHGANIDARPFLKTLIGPDNDASSDPAGKSLDLDLHSTVMTGQNSQALTAVDLRMTKRDGKMQRLQVSGKFGRNLFEIKSNQQGRDLVLNAASADAGATLAFFDLYKKVSGGKLETTIHLADNKFDGYATIHGFALREDPAMKRLTEEGISQEKKSDVQIDTSNLAFTKLYLLFSKSGSRVDIKDGGMFGQQMGATVQGWIDLAHDRIQLGGTYVPAYGVNNLFSQIPVVGPIFGGGAHEGLFGINYKITGSVASPNLTVDPLSALAPGFLRKIFGAISEATEEGNAPVPPGSTKARPDTPQ